MRVWLLEVRLPVKTGLPVVVREPEKIISWKHASAAVWALRLR
jgi:hypothetical protein